MLLTCCLTGSILLDTSAICRVWAYIDPGAGSLIIQILLGILFAGLFALKLFWNSIRSCLARLLGKEKNRLHDGD